MPNIFRAYQNVAVVHGSTPALLQKINVAGAPGFGGASTSLQDIGLLVTGVAISQGVRISYFTTLSESIYVYPLGNKVGKCMVTGLALPGCSTASASDTAPTSAALDEYTNLKKLMDFYERHKASNFRNIENPIKITIGSVVISGFLEDIQVNITNEAQIFGAATFNITLSVLPEMTAGEGS
jgi:hypothetical protein